MICSAAKIGDQEKVLIIDTSSEKAQVSYILDGEIIKKNRWSIGANAGKEVLEKISAILKESNAMLPEIDKIAVYCGPGQRSSALRSGITVAAFLAFACEAKLGIAENKNIADPASMRLSKPPHGVIKPNYNNPGFDNNKKKL